MSVRSDFDIIQQWITSKSRVLDLACGDGSLLKKLRQKKHIEGYGLEIDSDKITRAICNGINVIETNINHGLSQFSNESFDIVVMTQALQVMHYPHLVLEDMLRIGKKCIVTFPNFGNWRARMSLLTQGRMPVTKQLAYQWYDTPNIHFCTVKDFEVLCAELNIHIVQREFIAERAPDRQIKHIWPNLFSDTAIYLLSK